MSRRFFQGATLLCATLATGLTAGWFGDWAHNIMPGLAATDDATFVTALREFDRAVLGPLVMLTFLSALVLSGAAAVLYRRGDDRSPRPWVAAGFAFYLAAFVITIAVHEPLNLVIRSAGDPIVDPAGLREAFQETRWAVWHVVRTIATLTAFGCLAWALVLHGRATAHPATAVPGRPAPALPDRPARTP